MGEGIGIVKRYTDNLKIKQKYERFAFKFRVKIYVLLLRIIYLDIWLKLLVSD